MAVVLGCCGCCDTGVPGFRGSGVLGFWGAGVLGCCEKLWVLRVLGCWSAAKSCGCCGCCGAGVLRKVVGAAVVVVLECRGAGVLRNGSDRHNNSPLPDRHGA
ncbi:hypothetical protein K469DRAFT_688984 [Zopfia rhizophila CBS 207.26]|uniref:Uncharacterized protein n=1 Tax=Zopfia rhizophila CBS 207.26 TaxID=1314779 RepID=A0A6A6ERI0_9PEZI|nr:hypothetical protein K469DRAFT_688984 [Zopfia rhizophila CBS 207.26]